MVNTRSRGKKAKVFGAATKLFLEKGYQATSIADLAAAVGMLKGSLYYYIQSKDDLMCRVIVEALEAAEASLLQNADVHEDANNIQARIQAHFEYLSRNHVGLGLLLREAEQLPRSRRIAVKSRLEQYERILAQTLRAGQCCNVVTAGEPRAIARIMMAASTWVCWKDNDPQREAALNEGVLRLILSSDSAAETPRAKFPSAEAAALTAGRAALQFDSSPALSS
jgi:TetR/AcrR family transcriptional regulator, cholesterol catabolism regulator